MTGWYERAAGHFERAVAAHRESGRVVDAASATGQLGQVLHELGRGEQAVTRVREALASLEATAAPPEVVALLQLRLGGALLFSGHADEAAGAIEEALTLAQHHELAEPLASGANAKANLLLIFGRAEEARSAYELAISVARHHGLTDREMVAEGNLAELLMIRDLKGAEEHGKTALALARRWGLRELEGWAGGRLMYMFTMAGRFHETERFGAELLHAGGDERPGAGGGPLPARLPGGASREPRRRP